MMNASSHCPKSLLRRIFINLSMRDSCAGGLDDRLVMPPGAGAARYQGDRAANGRRSSSIVSSPPHARRIEEGANGLRAPEQSRPRHRLHVDARGSGFLYFGSRLDKTLRWSEGDSKSRSLSRRCHLILAEEKGPQVNQGCLKRRHCFARGTSDFGSPLAPPESLCFLVRGRHARCVVLIQAWGQIEFTAANVVAGYPGGHKAVARTGDFVTVRARGCPSYARQDSAPIHWSLMRISPPLLEPVSIG